MLRPNLQHFCCFAILLSISLVKLAAQNTGEITQSKSKLAIEVYENQFKNEFLFINGREYKPYHLPKHENPYLESVAGFGTIYMQGYVFEDKKLNYDIYKDLLIVNPEYYDFANVYIELNKTLVDSFNIQLESRSYQFINYKKENCLNTLNTGFYECLYKTSKTELLIKHMVLLGVDNALDTYQYKQQRFLRIDNRYYNITKKKQLLALFPDKKKVVRKKIKSIYFSYNKMSGKQLTQLIQFTATL
ncbi:hypothetical protein [Carboxylicivirga sp. M1479]|uniref:hypothetical protein n=1 Tax=Carboxylicivirga sp. M1479 TaxID=2594476 RepID=UPI0011787035|nr:hypothetical protein [Carboxylicivirga sp. M1479]TRX71689.1 hypothetical protein FNN09_05470 [Carboxylicivirga sp. M1479]